VTTAIGDSKMGFQITEFIFPEISELRSFEPEATPQSPFSQHNTVAGFSFSIGLLLVACAHLLSRLKPTELSKSRIGPLFH
jgi:hypothetical protein